MGISIPKTQQSIDILCQNAPQFYTDTSKSNSKAMQVWQITPQQSIPLKWPYKFLSSSSYIVLVASNSTVPTPILQKDRTSLQLAEMLFGAQFLCLHMRGGRRLMLNNRGYDIAVFSFYGDSADDEVMSRVRLAYYMDMIDRYLQLGAGSLCLSMLTQSQPVSLNPSIKQHIQFQSQQYEQSSNHPFFQQILFSTPKTPKQAINQAAKSLYLHNFSHGYDKLPHVDIKEMEGRREEKAGRGRGKDRDGDGDEDGPFACDITQINVKGVKSVPKVQGGNIDQSNILFDQLGIEEVQQSDKVQQFIKGLYLSTQKTSKNFTILNQHKIKLIINCSASTCKNWFINDINYKWIDMPDPVENPNQEYNIQCLIYQVADLAGKCLAEPSGVLLHCSNYSPKVAGSGSRSVVVLVGLLMSTLKLKFEDAYQMVTKKWEVTLPPFMQKQLKQLQRRTKQKPKGFHVYSICSYSTNFPKHLVAKYICQVENINNVQGIDDFAKHVFLCVGATASKIMIGKQCQQRQQYQKYAKQHYTFLTKYQSIKSPLSVEHLEKTFRKQPKVAMTEQILHQNLLKPTKNAGFKRNQQIVLRYPILRPVWEKKNQDGFYYTIREKGLGAQVVMNKGMNWIGYEEDKEEFFDRIVNTYLKHIDHDKIFIVGADQDNSLFDNSEINI